MSLLSPEFFNIFFNLIGYVKNIYISQSSDSVFLSSFLFRVFAKVRSRSAHMKSHRMNESDKKPVNKKPVPVPILDNIMPKMSPNG